MVKASCLSRLHSRYYRGGTKWEVDNFHLPLLIHSQVRWTFSWETKIRFARMSFSSCTSFWKWLLIFLWEFTLCKNQFLGLEVASSWPITMFCSSRYNDCLRIVIWPNEVNETQQHLPWDYSKRQFCCCCFVMFFLLTLTLTVMSSGLLASSYHTTGHETTTLQRTQPNKGT